MNKLLFWAINLLIAGVLLLLIGWGVLRGLNRYTRHGFFIEVPDLRGFTPEEAVSFTREKKLQTLVVDSIYDNDARPGTIVEQFPTPGSKVKTNRAIRLTINANTPEQVIFPNLRNHPFRQSIQRLSALGLPIGKISYASSEFKNLVLNFSRNGEVIEPQSLVTKGDTIDIILGNGNTVNEIRTPDLKRLSLEEVRSHLLYAFLNLGDITFDNTVRNAADRQSAFVYKQFPEAGEEERIALGESISVFLTRDTTKLTEVDSLFLDEEP